MPEEKHNSLAKQIREQASRRRTFAIISHPDAGKTTLTEKLLLYGGAIELAGSVTAKKHQRETASDWMELEQKRGISISSTVLQFDYGPYRLNLLDTPGHKDFSEDTYRVLMAVDSVIMVIDAGKGIESQTRKLFEICRRRGIPILTFMNKLDRPALSPLELIDQLESALSLHAFPVNWPLGTGTEFKGVYDRLRSEVFLFERVAGGLYRAPVTVHSLKDLTIQALLSEKTYRNVFEEVQVLDLVQGGFELGAVRKGKTTPVFFGSASNNFGVELLLKGFLNYSPEPAPRLSSVGRIWPAHPEFSAFVFKVQTNMNPRHRDRVVFARVCSGRFSRDMTVFHARQSKNVRLSDSFHLFGRDRGVIDEAYPGDIIGFVTRQGYRVGDTISTDPELKFEEIPRFAPECFAYIHNMRASTYKSFRKGCAHLLAEDIVQVFYLSGSTMPLPLLGAVGPLQFEVFQYRLKDEYRAESELEKMPWTLLRWAKTPLDDMALKAILPRGAVMATDDQNRRVILFVDSWSLNNFAEKHPEVSLHDSPIRIDDPVNKTN